MNHRWVDDLCLCRGMDRGCRRMRRRRWMDCGSGRQSTFGLLRARHLTPCAFCVRNVLGLCGIRGRGERAAFAGEGGKRCGAATSEGGGNTAVFAGPATPGCAVGAPLCSVGGSRRGV